MRERASTSRAPHGRILVRPRPPELTLRLVGHFTLDARLEGREAALAALTRADIRRLRVAATVERWDSRLVALILRLRREAAARGLALVFEGLPAGLEAVLELAARSTGEPPPPALPAGALERLGLGALAVGRALADALDFVGEIVLALGRLLRARADMELREFGWFVQRTGADGLAIIGLVGTLVGMVLAFVGASQLGRFGAEIYVADLVALGMVRETGALMTAIVVAGRSGAAFAAELASMRLGEEVDALEVLGVRVVDHLVLPRLLALVVTVPLLSLYAVFLGIAGGAVSAVALFDIPLARYLEQSRLHLDGTDFLAGLGKAFVFAWLVGFAGCYRGMRAPRSASGVGDAATSAVVLALVAIVCGDAVMTVIYYVLDI